MPNPKTDRQKPANDGGPAFPPFPPHVMPAGVVLKTSDTGMSLLDWFAGQALQGMLAANTSVGSREAALMVAAESGESLLEMWAAVAYGQAVAMLKQRENLDA